MTTVTIIGTFTHDILNTNLTSDPEATSFRVEAGHGDDQVISGWTADQIFGGKGDDKIWAGGGDDYVSAGNHNDFVDGGTGNDILDGGAGDDIVHGGKGNDIIYGGSGNDFLYGTKGSNELYGGTGNDFLNSGLHRSFLYGGDGDDTLQSDMRKGGDHVLEGGFGADTFEFVGQLYSKQSMLTISDFELGVDTFSIDGTSDQQFFDDYMLNGGDIFVDTTAGVTIVLTGGDELRFEGLEEADFIDHYLSVAV